MDVYRHGVDRDSFTFIAACAVCLKSFVSAVICTHIECVGL